MSEWSQMSKECTEEGEPTDLARALKAISYMGCDCDTETEELGSCLPCRCEKALKGQWERIKTLNDENKCLSSASAGATALSVEFASESAIVDKILHMGTQSLNPDLYENLLQIVNELRRVRRALKEEKECNGAKK